MKFEIGTWAACLLVVGSSGCALNRSGHPTANHHEPRLSVNSDAMQLPQEPPAEPALEADPPVQLASYDPTPVESQPTDSEASSHVEISDLAATISGGGDLAIQPVTMASELGGEAGGEWNGQAATLEELLALAFQSNPAIEALAATTQKAAGYRTQVGLYANPVIGYQAQQLADENTDQHLAFIDQEIVTGGKLQLNRAVLNQALRAQLQELEAQKLRVATDIKSAYYGSVRIQQQLTAIHRFEKQLSMGVDVAEKRLEAGEGSKIDLLQTRVQRRQLELTRRQLSASLEARLRELTALAGAPHIMLPGVADTPLPDQPTPMDWHQLENEIIATSPEYAAAQSRIREAVMRIRRHQAQPIPNLLVQLGAGYDNGQNSEMVNLQVGAPIPLFNRNQGNVAAARAEFCRAQQDAERIANAIRARLAVASGDYSRAAEAVVMYQTELLPAAQETLDLAEEAYRAGEQDFIQLLVTRRTYFDTKLAFLEAQGQLAIALARIDGYVLSGALNTVIDGSGDDSLRGLTFSQR